MANRTIKGTSAIPGYGSFLNVIHASNLALWDHYAGMFFAGDIERIIYASSDYAFKKRAKFQSNKKPNNFGNLDFPFMNFKIQPNGIINGGERNWWNMALNTQGMFVEELQRKIRLQPIEIEYDSKLYVHAESDLQYAMTLLHWDDSNETLLTPTVMIETDSHEQHTINNIGVLRYRASFNPDYNEKDWLEKNKIRVIEINMTLETFMILEDFRFGIPKTATLDLAIRTGAIDNTEEGIDMVWQKEIDHEEQGTTDLTEV